MDDDNEVMRNLGSDGFYTVEAHLPGTFNLSVAIDEDDVTLEGFFYDDEEDDATYRVDYYAYVRDALANTAVHVGNDDVVSVDGSVELSLELTSALDRLYFAVLRRTDGAFEDAPVYYYSAPVHPSRLVVTSLTKAEGVGSLRDAIEFVNSGTAGSDPIIRLRLPVGAILKPQLADDVNPYLPPIQLATTLDGNGHELDLTDVTEDSDSAALVLEPGGSVDVDFAIDNIVLRGNGTIIHAKEHARLALTNARLYGATGLILDGSGSRLENVEVRFSVLTGVLIGENTEGVEIENSVIDSSWHNYFPQFSPLFGYGTAIHVQGNGAQIADVLIPGAERYGIWIEGADAKVEDTTILNTGGTAIKIDADDPGTRISVTGTKIYHVQGRAIDVGVNSENAVVLLNNLIWDTSTGFDLDTPLSSLTGKDGNPLVGLGDVKVTFFTSGVEDTETIPLGTSMTVGDVMNALVFQPDGGEGHSPRFYARFNEDRSGIELAPSGFSLSSLPTNIDDNDGSCPFYAQPRTD
jgi:hypothetical protein